jgi:hypothetical protein
MALSPPLSANEYERRLLAERAAVNGSIPVGRMGRSEKWRT